MDQKHKFTYFIMHEHVFFAKNLAPWLLLAFLMNKNNTYRAAINYYKELQTLNDSTFINCHHYLKKSFHVLSLDMYIKECIMKLHVLRPLW